MTPSADAPILGAMHAADEGAGGGGRGRGTKRRSRPAPAETQERPGTGFGRPNVLLFAAALVVIVVGYVLLGRGSVTAAPLLLVLGYVVLIPAGLLVGMGRGDPEGG